MKQTLKIQNYELWVNLGCSKEEQTYLQPVLFNIELQFDQTVTGAETDLISDAVDYVELTKIIQEIGGSKKFHLIEHLNLSVVNNLKSYLSSKKIKAKLIVNSQKLRVPVEYLRDGVVFTCEEQL